MNKKLYRDEYHKTIGGVCAGLSEYFDVDVSIIRILFVITAFVSVGFLTYVVLWIVLPRKGYIYNNFNNPTVDYRVPPQQPAGDPSGMPPPQPGNPQNSGGNPFGNSPYGNAPYSNASFGNTPYSNAPFGNDPVKNIPRQKSHAGIIFGVVLIVIGGIILIENYDLIPDFDFERLWPVVLVIVGASLLVSGQASRMRHKPDYQNTGNRKDTPQDNPPTTDDATITEP